MALIVSGIKSLFNLSELTLKFFVASIADCNMHILVNGVRPYVSKPIHNLNGRSALLNHERIHCDPGRVFPLTFQMRYVAPQLVILQREPVIVELPR